jgi:hypothetical protein
MSKTTGSHYYQPIILGLEFGITYDLENWTIDEWIKHGTGVLDWERYPNAIAAKNIMDSKLYKTLK